MKTFFLSLLVYLYLSALAAQQPNNAVLQEQEFQLDKLFDDLYQRNTTKEVRKDVTGQAITIESSSKYIRSDTEKKEVNANILTQFAVALKTDGSFLYPFDSLKFVNILASPDGRLRIYNWNIGYDDGAHEYFGFIQYLQKPENKYLIFPLTDKSATIEKPEKTILNHDNWYGAFYYQLVEKKGDHTYYTLLGWDGNDDYSTKRLVDVLYFDNNNPVFGAAIFTNGAATANRVIFEHSKKSTMFLKYLPERDEIVFDHLSPPSPFYDGQYAYYGPDFSYDAFAFVNGKWAYKPDIDFKNLKKEQKRSDKPEKGLIYEESPIKK